MRRIIAVMAVLLLMSAGPVLAASASAPTITAQAQVDGSLSITVALFRDSVIAANEIAVSTNMDFGQLADIGTGTLRSTSSIIALIAANSHSLPYTVTQSATSLTDGGNTLNDGSFVVTPVYAAEDNLLNPAGSANEGTMGAPGSAVGSSTIYTSGGVHSQRIVQAVYGISDDPLHGASGGISLDQPQGSYTANVVITITA